VGSGPSASGESSRISAIRLVAWYGRNQLISTNTMCWKARDRTRSGTGQPVTTIQMLPSGWITRWSNPGVYKPIIPCNRRQDFCCAGKIDCSPILIIRDAKIINMTATYGTTEMVIAVKPAVY
jgi:hypothetical protein